jgi:hypothetical protein
MRKPYFITRIILPAVLCTGILFLFLAFAPKVGKMDCTAAVKEECPRSIEQFNGTEVLWESLTNQFLISVSQ